MVSAKAQADQHGITEGGLVMFAAVDDSGTATSDPDRVRSFNTTLRVV